MKGLGDTAKCLKHRTRNLWLEGRQGLKCLLSSWPQHSVLPTQRGDCCDCGILRGRPNWHRHYCSAEWISMISFLEMWPQRLKELLGHENRGAARVSDVHKLDEQLEQLHVCLYLGCFGKPGFGLEFELVVAQSKESSHDGRNDTNEG